MKYFDYQVGKMGKVWDLFSDLAGAGEETLAMKDSWARCDYGHTMEIINSALNGNIFNEEGSFSLKLYEIACQNKEKVDKLSKKNKNVSIVEMEDEEDSRVGYKEVPSSVLKYEEEKYDQLEDMEMFENCMTELLSIRYDCMIDLGLDPIELLRSALQGIPGAVRQLKELKDERLKGLILSLCEYGRGILKGRLDTI